MIGMFIGILVSFLDSHVAVHKFDFAPLQKHLLVREQLCNRLLLKVFGCLHILCYGAWLSFVQSLPVSLLVLYFASCASLAGLLVLSILVLFCFAKQLVRLLLWFRSSHCRLQCAHVL